MARIDYLFVSTDSGERIHRASCKRTPSGEGVKPRTLDEIEPAVLAGATMASCCKPRGAQVYIDEAIEATRRSRPKTADVPEARAEAPKVIEETEALLEEIIERHGLELDEPEVDLTGISKHYHDAMRKVHATREEALAAFSALKTWRRGNAIYKALPPQDTKWVTSERYAWERDFLIGYAAGLAGSDPQKTYTDKITPARQGHKAALADIIAAADAEALI
jgi:hypothetical protein